MTHADRERWDAKYSGRPVPAQLVPDDWLRAKVEGQSPGRALELACGFGHNSLWLASHGWQVDAVDISAVGIASARTWGESLGQNVRWLVQDLDTYLPEEDAYDLVLIFRFLDRDTLPRIVQQALKPGGILVCEMFSQAELQRLGTHLHNPAYTLNPGELEGLFPQLKAIDSVEVSLPDRAVARFYGRLAAVASGGMGGL